MGSQYNVRMYRGSPTPVSGLTVRTSFYIYRRDYSDDTTSPWGFGNTSPIASAVATLSDGDPVAISWHSATSVAFATTPVAALRAEGASVSATLGVGGAAYSSGDPIMPGSGDVVITAAPMYDDAGHDGSLSPSRGFWKWVCTETEEEFLSGQITVGPPPSNETHTYTAFWIPNSVLVAVVAGDNGVEVAQSDDSGVYYAKDDTGEPAMPLFYARVVAGQETDRKFDRWMKTVYSIDETTGAEVAGTPVEVDGIYDEGTGYTSVQTVRETDALVSRVVYTASSSFSHDRVAACISNTYLLKGAAYSISPAIATRFGAGAYAGAYSLSYSQPTGVDYTVQCRKAGDLAAGTVTGGDSGTFTDGGTGKLWAASYILFAVNAAGTPVGPEEDPTVPEDPDEPMLPDIGGGGGGGGGSGAGSPVGTGISLQIVSTDTGVTAGVATLELGGDTLLTASYPDTPVAVKSATQGSVYLLSVTGIAPTAVIVQSVTANGVALVASGTTWPVIAGSGSTSIVVTLGFPPLKTLLVNAVSVPSGADPDNSVTISPAPDFAPDRWIAGTVITLTPVPVTGYSNILWERDDSAGLHDEEAGGSAYAFALDNDTVVTAGFSRPSLDVVLTVKGSEALAAQFDWTYEEATADDTVPVSMTHSLFPETQLGIFKIGSSKLQTAGDAVYNTYVDMPIAGVDVSYDAGVTWEDAGGSYPEAYNAQRTARAAARVGKHTVSGIPANNVLYVRIRLTATVSVSVGMPPVRWGGPPTWSAAGSMIGTGQNNWGCGLGSATISHKDAMGVDHSAVMVYHIGTLANPGATTALAALTAEEAAPYGDYFDAYPWLNVELGDTVDATCVPDTGFYFAAWIDGYFSHTWEDVTKLKTAEDRLLWPVTNYISTDVSAAIVVDEGMKKIMLKMKATIVPRYVLFTQDSGAVMAVRPGNTAPESIVPFVGWSYYQDATYLPYMKFTPSTSAAWSGTFAQFLTAWNATEAAMTALGITSTNCTIWQVNRSNVATVAERIAFFVGLSWGSSSSGRFDTDPSYLGVYRRAHLTDVAGNHQVGEWEFVGRGVAVLNVDGISYQATYLAGLAQKFVTDLEYRVRWVPYVAPVPNEDYQITVGYHDLTDMEQGTVSMTIGGIATGDINSRVQTYAVLIAETVVLTAVPRPGFTFVSWVNGADPAVVISTAAIYTVNHNTDGVVFLGIFTAEIVTPPDNITEFHVGFVDGNTGRGSIGVRIWRADTTIEDTTVTAEAGAAYQLHAGDNAYVWAIAGTGWVFGGWLNAYGLPCGGGASYWPRVDTGAGVALRRDVYFSAPVVPPVTGNVPFRAGFLDPAAVPHALGLISVNGALVATLNGLQYADMLLTEGDSVSMEVIAATGYLLSGYVDLTYEPVSLPVSVLNVSVTAQGVLAVLGVVAPPVDPPPDVTPGTPVTGAGLWLFDAGAENKAFVWRSRRFETPVPIDFNSVKVARNGSYFPTAVAFRLNAYSSPEMTSANTDINIAVTDEAPRRLPKIRRERYFEVEITAKDDIECVKLATSMGELQNG